MPFEDLALMRAIPKADVYEVSDGRMLKYVLIKGYEKEGFSYIRSIRKQAFQLHTERTDFSKGAVVLREGEDAAILASGIMVHEALLAAEELSSQGIEAKVVDVFQIKPINQAMIIEAAETGAIVTAENHNVIGGLGSAVAEVLCENCPTPLSRVGVRESFGQVGKTAYLKEVYGLTKEEIMNHVQRLVAGK